MRQINFVIGFVIVFGLVLFSLENPGMVMIQIVPGSLELKLPLCIAMIGAMGFGALLVWVLSVWAEIQGRFNKVFDRRKIREQERQIDELQDELSKSKIELDKKKQLERMQEDLERYRTILEEQRILPAAENKS
ncbi:MAG: LapA family protein [Prochlorothrix sp.]